MTTATRRAKATEATQPPGGEGVRYSSVVVTDAVAQYWLEHNAKNNRGPKGRKLKQYAHDMLEGAWRQTGETIAITEDPWVDEDGEPRTDPRMIDGGQRMRAVRLAAETNPDVKVEMDFAWGVPFDAIFVTNTGSARTFSDGLGFKERINRNSLGAIVRRVWYWEHGNYVATGGTNTPFIDPTMRDLHELEESNIEEFDAATARGMDIRAARVSNPTAAGTTYYLFNRIDHDEAGTFFDHLVKGANLADGSPILALRNRLMTAHLSRNKQLALTTTEQVWLFIRAWNAYRRDETLSGLVLPTKFVNSRFIQPI